MLNMNESRHVWMSHVMYEWVVLYMNESCDMMCDVIWCAMWYDVRACQAPSPHPYGRMCACVCACVWCVCVCVCLMRVCVRVFDAHMCVCLMHTCVCACLWCLHACVRLFDAYNQLNPRAWRNKRPVWYMLHRSVCQGEALWYASVCQGEALWYALSLVLYATKPQVDGRTHVCVCVCVCVCVYMLASWRITCAICCQASSHPAYGRMFVCAFVCNLWMQLNEVYGSFTSYARLRRSLDPLW